MTNVSDQITNLKVSQHGLIISVDEIQQSRAAYFEIKNLLRDLQKKLFSHFALQDQDFYKELSETFAQDREKSKLIEFLIHDLKDIKVNMLIFFDQHPADMGDVREVNFRRDFADFAHRLTARLASERDCLMPLLAEMDLS